MNSLRSKFAASRQARRALRAAGKLIAAMSVSSNWLMRLAGYPKGAALCLALAYIILCGAYIFISGRLAASAARSLGQLRNLEMLKGVAFVVITGAAFYWLASRLFRHIAAQRQHLALIFQRVSDSLFLLKVEASDGYRFLVVNAAFLKLTGLTREQVEGQRIEDVLTGPSLALAKAKYQEAIRERKSVSWEDSFSYSVGKRVGESTVTPLADKSGTIDQLACVVRDITERALASQLSELYGRKLRRLSRRLVEAQETERRHIARELHDEIGQGLTVAQLNLQTVLQTHGAGDSTRRLSESLEAVERVQGQVHDISLNLRPSMLDDLGLEPALRWIAERQAALAGLRAEFAIESFAQRLDPTIETQCFRIAQEALTNVVRHAQAQIVTVGLRTQDGRLHLSVRDDGVGFDLTPVRDKAVLGASLGLLSMEERATLVDGGLEFMSSRAKVPMSRRGSP